MKSLKNGVPINNFMKQVFTLEITDKPRSMGNRLIERFFVKTIKTVRVPEGGGRVAVTFVNDREIRKFNKKYRKKDKVTDVVSLSYAGCERFPGDDLLGEIFISIDTAKKQAQEFKRTQSDELLFLFVHGLLHVFGYDHMKKAEREEMFARHGEIMGRDAGKWYQKKGKTK